MSTTALLDLGIAVRPNGPIEQRVQCPRCDKGSRDRALGANIITGAFHCFRCEWKGYAAGNQQTASPFTRMAPRTTESSGETPSSAVVAYSTAGLSEYGNNLWSECLPLEGAALEYLKHRHCALPPADGDLRFHPALKHPGGHVGAALVALVTHAATGAALTLHRTWITATGKANVDPPRLLLKGHGKAGGVIRLWPDEAVTYGLGISEGIETALAAAHGFTPVWSCIDAGNMAKLPLLEGINSLMIFADNDGTGIKAARQVAQRWAGAHRAVKIVMSERTGCDIADELADQGAS